MKFTRFTLLLAAASTVLYSCSKDETDPGGNNPDTLKGTYDFVGMTVASQSTVTVTGSGVNEMTITTSNYVTKNNGGTVTVDATNFTNTDFIYSVDTVVNAKSYSDGVFESEMDIPFKFDVPKLSSHAPYKLVGTDSIYFEKGFVENPDGSGTGVASTPSGSKWSWSGDTLILRTKLAVTNQQTQGGYLSKTVNIADQVVKLKKRK
ncbi:MAG TPA: hypothetical protein VGE90_17955 [Chitinophaga sp.]